MRLLDRLTQGIVALWQGALALVLAAGVAQAGCTSSPAPEVDWTGCSKERLMLDGDDLSGAVFNFAFLSGISLRGANLAGASFFQAELARASFAQADLTSTNFEKALASRAEFSGAAMAGARLVKAEFLRVRFIGSDLTGADLSEAVLLRNDFSGARLGGVSLVGAIVPRGVFRGAVMAGVDVTDAFLFRSEFQGVDLREIRGLTQAQLDETCGDDATMLPPGWRVRRAGPAPRIELPKNCHESRVFWASWQAGFAMRGLLFLLLLSLTGLVVAVQVPGWADMLLLAGPSAVACLILILRKVLLMPARHPAPEPRLEPKRNWIIVDGSNVLYWKNSAPQIDTLRDVLRLLRERGYSPGVVFDANAAT